MQELALQEDADIYTNIRDCHSRTAIWRTAPCEPHGGGQWYDAIPRRQTVRGGRVADNIRVVLIFHDDHDNVGEMGQGGGVRRSVRHWWMTGSGARGNESLDREKKCD